MNRFPLTTMKIKSVSLPLQMGEGGGGQKGLGPLPLSPEAVKKFSYRGFGLVNFVFERTVKYQSWRT